MFASESEWTRRDSIDVFPTSGSMFSSESEWKRRDSLDAFPATSSMFPSESERKRRDFDVMLEDIRQKYHDISNQYQSKVSVEKSNQIEIEELRRCLEYEREERKKEKLKYEEEIRKNEIHWNNEVQRLKTESDAMIKMCKDRVEALQKNLGEIKRWLLREMPGDMKYHAKFLAEAFGAEESMAKKSEVVTNEQQKECNGLIEKLATEEEKLTTQDGPAVGPQPLMKHFPRKNISEAQRRHNRIRRQKNWLKKKLLQTI